MRVSALFLLLAVAQTPAALALDKAGVEYVNRGGKPLLLNLHVPEGKGPFPAAILVHGGGFDAGDRTMYINALFPVLSKADFAWFTIDYRLAPKAHMPEAVDDVRAAIAWVRDHANEYHLAPGKLALIGESAGGYLVNYAGTHETDGSRVDAVVDFYGASDYEKLAQARANHPELFNMDSVKRHVANGGGIAFFGVNELDVDGLKKLRAASPIHNVHGGMPPFLCIHGNKDDQVLYEQSVEFCAAIQKAGNTCKLVTVDGGRHGMNSWRDADMQGWKTEMVNWLRSTLHVPAT